MTFNNGDKIVDVHGNTATVVGARTYLQIQWDGWPHTNGLWPAEDFKLVGRPFKPGDFVRVLGLDPGYFGLVGMVFEDDGEDDAPYWVALYNEAGDDVPFYADELELWTPRVGDEVLELNAEDGIVGVVIGLLQDDASVLWEGFPVAQRWPLSELEPFDEYSDEDEDLPEVESPALQPDSFEPNERVEYHNPFFASALTARVVRVGDGVTFLKFADGAMPDGFYDNDFIQKAA